MYQYSLKSKTLTSASFQWRLRYGNKTRSLFEDVNVNMEMYKSSEIEMHENMHFSLIKLNIYNSVILLNGDNQNAR